MCGDVEVERRLEGLVGELEHRRGRRSPGVVDQDVDPPELLDGLGDQPVQVAGLVDVAGDRQGAAPEAADLLGGHLDLLGGAGGADHVGAGLAEGVGDAATDAAPGSGDDGDLVIDAESIQDHGSLQVPRVAPRSHLIASGLIGDPTAPVMGSGGAVKRKA
jgi:hypothetical protein